MNTNFSYKYNRGQAVITSVIILLMIAMTLVFGNVIPALADARHASEFIESTKANYIASGGLEDISYRAIHGLSYDDSEVVTVGEGTATIETSQDIFTGELSMNARGEKSDSVRILELSLIKGESVNFNNGVQVGNGGVEMLNNSKINGNIYANATITASGNLVSGTAVSAGPNGYINDVETTVSAYAHTIEDSAIGTDAYYQTIINTTVGSSSFPGSIDLPIADLPIDDETFDEWEQLAADTEIVECSDLLKIEDDVSMGPIKYTCDVEIAKGAAVTLTGMVWVEGDFEISGNSTLAIDPLLDDKSIAIIAHDPADEITRGLITLSNNSELVGTGEVGSFIMFVSRNTDPDDHLGIRIINNAVGDIFLYTNHGKVEINNNSELVAIVAHLLVLKNNAEVNYDEGIANSVFETGPGSSWEISTWREVQ